MLKEKEAELEEKERILSLNEYHLQVSNSILIERERIVKNKIKTIRAFSGISFIIGFLTAVVFIEIL